VICFVCLRTKPVGEPDAGNPHVRFDERGWETERCRMAQATAPIYVAGSAYGPIKFDFAFVLTGHSPGTATAGDPL
jgi:hypothetical protein